MSRNVFKYSLLVGAALGVSACTMFDPWAGGQRIDTAEDLLAAEGTWHLVDEKRIPTPVQQHKMARKAVDPEAMTNGHYTTQEKPQMMASGQDVHFRLLRMEREVQSLRRDFNKLLPPLKSLLVSDAQLKSAIRDVENAQGMSAHTAPAPQPVVKKAVPKRSSAKAVSKLTPATGGPGVRRVRIGDHPAKTRMVLDLSAPGGYSYDLDNDEKLLLVELSSSPWSTRANRTFTKHPLIAGYSASDNGSGGTMLAIQLKKPVKVLETAALKPNSVHGHRIMIDLAAM